MRPATNDGMSCQGDTSMDHEHQPDIMDASQFTDCLESVHNLFRVFTSLDMSAVRALPAVYFIRTIHAAIALVKLYFAAMRLPDSHERSARKQDLKVDEYLNQMLLVFTSWGELWPADKLTKVLGEIRIWFEQNSDRTVLPEDMAWLDRWAFKQSPSQEPGEPIEPPAPDPPGQHQAHLGSIQAEKQHAEAQERNTSAAPNIFQSMPPGNLPLSQQVTKLVPSTNMLHDDSTQPSIDWVSSPAGPTWEQELPSVDFDQTVPFNSLEMELDMWLDANIGVGAVDGGNSANYATDELHFG